MPPWRPLLAGPDAAPVWEAIAGIAEVLRPGDPASTPEPEQVELHEPSVAGGAAGQALFFAYLALHRDALAAAGAPLPALPPAVLESAEEHASRLLDRACDALASVPTTPDLYSGFAGVGWTVEHLQGGPGVADPADDADADADANAEIDAAVLELVAQSPWLGDYDLIRGLTGLGVYAVERLPRPGAVACLERVVERLAELAEQGEDGVTWFTPPELLPEHQRASFPRGVYNLGVAHGMPAVIGLLAAAAAADDAGLSRSPARALLAGAVRWLLAHRMGAESPSCFAYSIAPGAAPQPARLAWCYGDAGVAAALLAAGEAATEPAWRRSATEIARAAAARPMADAGVVDAGLCHGAAGLAHLFNRMFQSTGEPALEAAAVGWLRDALSRREPGLGLAGWRALKVDPGGGARRMVDSPGFLEGVAGIGLALLAAVSPVEPAWDRLLMASLRAPAAGTGRSTESV
jgi:hypothetical protein